TLMLDPYLQRMQGKPFRSMTRTRGIAIEQGKVIVGPAPLMDATVDTTELPADTIVLVSGNRQNREVYDALRGRIEQLHSVGDANSPRYLETAIREGHLAGAAV